MPPGRHTGARKRTCAGRPGRETRRLTARPIASLLMTKCFGTRRSSPPCCGSPPPRQGEFVFVAMCRSARSARSASLHCPVMPTIATTLRCAPACALLALALAACETTPEAQSLARKMDLDTAPITHVVLVQLKDPSRAAELVQDCDRALPSIEGVAGYSCGVPLLTGRTNVTSDYDVGIYVGFRDEAAYRTYVDHPRHLGLVEGWREGWKAVRIFDIVEGVPAAAPVQTQPLKPETAKVVAPVSATPSPVVAPVPAVASPK